jgi:hypothetical protein
LLFFLIPVIADPRCSYPDRVPPGKEFVGFFAATCEDRYNRVADLEVSQALLWSTHEKVLWCVTRSHVNTLFGDSVVEKEAFIGYYV